MKILIIQTAFIGDVILATPVVEKLYRFFPDADIDFLVRKGNESLLFNHPKINEVIIWDKKQNKISNLFKLIFSTRRNKYDFIINAHRFASSGFITALSNAKLKIGFDKNPLSFLFSKKIRHEIGSLHEVDRKTRRTSGDGLDIQETLHEIRHSGHLRCGGKPGRIVSLPGILVCRDSISRHAAERVSGGGDLLRNRE